MERIKVSDLRHRVEFQTLTETADGQGGFVATWNTFDTVWANVVPASGSEKVMAQKLEENYDYNITIRYKTGLNSKMRIVFNGRIFHIKSIIIDEERKWFTRINAKEGIPA